MGDQLRERDKEISQLRESVIRMEGDIKALSATMGRVETEQAKAETAGLRAKVEDSKAQIEKLEKRLDSNDAWIRALLISMIFLLLGFVFNFVMIRLNK